MLVLTRKAGQRICASNLVIDVLEVRRGKVKLGFSAPREVNIVRAELLTKDEQETIENDTATRYFVGNIVQWTSQSTGTVKTKQGQVLVVVPAGKDPEKCFRKSGSNVYPYQLSTTFFGHPRNHESYIVAVGAEGTLYWPRVRHLQLVQSVSGKGA